MCLQGDTLTSVLSGGEGGPPAVTAQNNKPSLYAGNADMCTTAPLFGFFGFTLKKKLFTYAEKKQLD